jgi:hypothetical protein
MYFYYADKTISTFIINKYYFKNNRTFEKTKHVFNSFVTYSNYFYDGLKGAKLENLSNQNCFDK